MNSSTYLQKLSSQIYTLVAAQLADEILHFNKNVNKVKKVLQFNSSTRGNMVDYIIQKIFKKIKKVKTTT